jgi:hypothetical protein
VAADEDPVRAARAASTFFPLSSGMSRSGMSNLMGDMEPLERRLRKTWAGEEGSSMEKAGTESEVRRRSRGAVLLRFGVEKTDSLDSLDDLLEDLVGDLVGDGVAREKSESMVDWGSRASTKIPRPTAIGAGAGGVLGRAAVLPFIAVLNFVSTSCSTWAFGETSSGALVLSTAG